MARLTRGSSGEGGRSALESRSVRGVRRVAALVTAGALAAATLVAPGSAHAEEATGTGKGIAGGALLGGEAVMAVEALAGVQSTWAYAVGGILGAGAGGVGGYFIESGTDSGRVPLYMLAGGMALVIPAAILALNATAYKPPADYQEDEGRRENEPVAEPPAPSGAPTGPAAAPPPPTGASRAKTRAPRLALRPLVAPRFTVPSSMLRVSGEGVRLGVPAVDVRPVFSQADMRQYGMTQAEEVRVPVFSAVF
jgi:hypothetical protein